MSAAVAEVVELLGQLTTGGAIQRGRAAVQAAHIVGRLTGEQKRQLAIDVAERVAPQLVPRIEAETGTDLTPAQVSALLDMFRRLDADQVQELSRAVRERDASSEAVQGVVASAMAVAGIDSAVGPAAGAPELDDAGADDETDGEVESAPDDPTEAAAEAARAAAVAEAEEQRRMALAAAEAQRDAARAAAEEERTTALAEAERRADAAIERARRKAAGVAAGVAGAVGSALGRRAEPEPLAPDPTPAADTTFADLALDWDFDAAPGQRSGTDLHEGGATEAAPEPQGHDDPLLADLRAVPEGFRRRRAAQAAIAEGRVTDTDAAAVCALFDRPGDRTWIAGDLVAAGLISIADLERLLPRRAAARLVARLDRVG